MSDNTLDIVKSGESLARISLIRSAKGLRVEVKAHPSLEEFFRQNSVHQGQTDPTLVQVAVVGRFWQTKDGTNGLTAYDRVVQLPVVLPDSTDVVNIDRLGQPLLEPHTHPSGRRSHSVNLSFLRLVGISDPEGVVFYVRGVHSIDLVRETKEKVGEAVRRFYATYLKPVEMSILVQTQEVSLPGIVEIRR